MDSIFSFNKCFVDYGFLSVLTVSVAKVYCVVLFCFQYISHDKIFNFQSLFKSLERRYLFVCHSSETAHLLNSWSLLSLYQTVHTKIHEKQQQKNQKCSYPFKTPPIHAKFLAVECHSGHLEMFQVRSQKTRSNAKTVGVDRQACRVGDRLPRCISVPDRGHPADTSAGQYHRTKAYVILPREHLWDVCGRTVQVQCIVDGRRRRGTVRGHCIGARFQRRAWIVAKRPE